jgi:hypothetical protein
MTLITGLKMDSDVALFEFGRGVQNLNLFVIYGLKLKDLLRSSATCLRTTPK